MESIQEWIVILIIAIIGAWLCNSFLLMNTEVPTGSMADTIPKPSRIISSRIHYWFDDPERGDVVLFDPPFEEEYYYVKRIIGLPGETVTIRNGLVYIGDATEPLDEPYLAEVPRGNFGPYQVPEDCYFMLGDNRNHSNDSRYWNEKYVPRENIYAKALFVYWPRISLIR
ncbi:MAG: signal peptidase I [Lachnospiraceae bacterium]|nr:signal peptidase I [Lachnospiraceae bacterium]